MRTRVLFMWILFLSSVKSWTIRNVDEDANVDELSNIELEGDDKVNVCDKLLDRKEPEDENMDHEIDGAFDGDEILSEEQLKLVTSDILPTQNNTSEEKRKLSRLMSTRWPYGIIPWVFDVGRRRFRRFRSYMFIKMAVDHWQTYTCLKFINIRTQKRAYDAMKSKIKHGHFLSFGTGKGCGSHVGYNRVAAQPVYLREPGCVRPGTVIHEIGHAIGFFHEQNRHDRDAVINIHYDNIREGKTHNFRKIRSQDTVPYDVGSVMHYGQKYFSKDRRLQTITAKDGNLNFLFGQRAGLSFYDVMTAHAAYKCTDHCRHGANNICQNGGFVYKDCSCACPEGLTGTYCEEIELSWTNDGCSKIFTLEENEKIIITSPNYDKAYDPVKCLWLIKAPNEKHLKAYITINDIPHDVKTHRCYHWLEIRYHLMGQHGPRYCGKKAVHDLPPSLENLMIVMFDGHDARYTGTGFKMAIKVDKEPGVGGPITCKNGKRHTDSDGSEYCECPGGFGGKLCEIVGFAYCTFEKNLCIFENKDNNDVDWKTGTARLPEGVDSLSGYIFVDTQKAVTGNKAIIISTIIESGVHCIVFHYSLYSINIGKINVGFIKHSADDVISYDLQVDKKNMWHDEHICVKSADKFKVEFEFIMNSGSEFDVALQNVVIDEGECQMKSLTAMACLDSKQVYKKAHVVFSCNFDDDDCGFVTSPSSSISWKRVKSALLGPYKDHTSGNGTFMAESKFMKVIDDVATMTSNTIDVCGHVCLSFWYASRGIIPGNLEVFVKTVEKTTSVIKYDKIPPTLHWTVIKLTLPVTTSFKLVFSVQAVHLLGTAAVDDITVTAGPC